MRNHLQYETSPYLLQHMENPVDWYPWGEEAFQRAKEEDKPVFLSIGYSTCHWCHVMAHESFEDPETAALLNQHFISIKVDKEERPDVDSVYMAVCQTFTGSGGWPTSIFMTWDQKPFFAGTYFPPRTRGGMLGLRELLCAIQEAWNSNRDTLLQQAGQIIAQLQPQQAPSGPANSTQLLERAVKQYKQLYDPAHGGFGRAPKFPTPHNLLFLLTWHQRRGDPECLHMAEHTLTQMFRGGLFDHIGYGFSRYSTDAQFLVPHFEKMLYDNALLILAYCKAWEVTQKPFYRDIAEMTVDYILREMTAPEGGFYCAQDADSDGEEGKYYLFTPDEVTTLLGTETGEAFNRQYDITKEGNFEGKSIPNCLKTDPDLARFRSIMPRLAQYRKTRCALHLDDKILTAWNGWMIAAMCRLYRVTENARYLDSAKRSARFLRDNLYQDGVLYVSFRAGKRGAPGFLDDYASYAFAQLALYDATLDAEYLHQAQQICKTAVSHFQAADGGFYLYGGQNEALILRPKETYDGAIPSGNSLMAWVLVRLGQLTAEECYVRQAARQLAFLTAEATQFPVGHAMFLLTLLDEFAPPAKITAVSVSPADRSRLPLTVPLDTALLLLPEPNQSYPLKNNTATYYVCRGHVCLPPSNDLSGLENG